MSDMVRAKFRATPAHNGFVAIWLVDGEGYQLHTEPVCAVPEHYHQWFVAWLEQQECPERFPAVIHDRRFNNARKNT